MINGLGTFDNLVVAYTVRGGRSTRQQGVFLGNIGGHGETVGVSSRKLVATVTGLSLVQIDKLHLIVTIVSTSKQESSI